MRHGNSINHLSRTYGHRKAMLRNMAVSLILNKRINTTLAKAKELRKFVEPVLTRSKADTMHNRRMVFADLQDKEAVKELFGQVAEKIATRPGGYTRIIKTGFRLGDAAEMCMMELVDFNDLLLADSASRKAKTTRRSRSSSRKGGGASAALAAAPGMMSEGPAPVIQDAVEVEEVSAAVTSSDDEAITSEPVAPEHVTESEISDLASDEVVVSDSDLATEPASNQEATEQADSDPQTDEEEKGA